MTATSKNFAGNPDPDVGGETHFVSCNFAQPAPTDIGGETYRGIRLFPAVSDATGWIFEECNLCNAEPPPNATCIGCNTTILRPWVPTTTDTVTIDGVDETVQHHSTFIYGRYDPDAGTYIDLPTPTEVEKD